MKCCLYARVSTGKQDYDNQITQLKEFCKGRNWEVIRIYSETISGKESERPEFKRMMEDAARHEFDAIVVWALDRFTREGTEKVWHYLSLIRNYNVQFISFKEPYFNTDNEMVRDILFSVMGSLAKQERIRMSERTKAGLDRAKRAGIQLGKPAIAPDIKKQIIDLRNQGKSYKDIQKEVIYWTKSRNKKNVSMGFISKVLEQDKSSQNPE